jgi:uncharacterized membrane protein (DUF4010 family)
MTPDTTPDLTHLEAFATSVAIGLLIGLERERRPSARAGLRTCALVALLGTLAAMLGQIAASTWLPAAGLAIIGLMMISSYFTQPDPSDPGTTTVVAVLVCYCLGAAVWFGYVQLAVMLAITTTVLLYFKAELEGITERLTSRDLISILQFAVLSLVVLPILPNRGFGPFQALNPHQIWLMVVLIAGVSLTGYAALRLVGARHGAPVIGMLGGLVSSTATTLVFSRHARQDSQLVPTAVVVILLANLTMIARLVTIVGLLAPAVLRLILTALLPGLLIGLATALLVWRRQERRDELPMPEVRNPTEIRSALGFGLMYALILVCAAWLSDALGDKGLYGVALVSGLTDVDAITLSSLRLLQLHKLSEQPVMVAIALAVLSNLVFKLALVAGVGGVALARRTLPSLALVAVTIGTSVATTLS